MKLETTSICPQVETALALVNMLTDNFHSYNEGIESIGQVHHGEGGNTDVMNRHRCVESGNHLSVSRILVPNVLNWLEFLLFSNFGYYEKLLEVRKSQQS